MEFNVVRSSNTAPNWCGFEEMPPHLRSRKGYTTTRDCGFCKWYSISPKGHWVCTHVPTLERRQQEIQEMLAKWARPRVTGRSQKKGGNR